MSTTPYEGDADESMYPTKAGKPTANHFNNPTAPVHFLTGNGGPPTIDLFEGKVANFSHTRSEKFGCVMCSLFTGPPLDPALQPDKAPADVLAMASFIINFVAIS